VLFQAENRISVTVVCYLLKIEVGQVSIADINRDVSDRLVDP
jgi:hypothetical protein